MEKYGAGVLVTIDIGCQQKWNVTFQQISKFHFENWFCNASNVSFDSCRVTNTVVKPRKCIDIVLRVNKVIKAVEM